MWAPRSPAAWVVLVVVLGACASSPPSPGGGEATYLERRAAHRTTLTRRHPITNPTPDVPTPAGAVRVEYPSGDLVLFGWLAVPPVSPGASRPAVVFFHGGFALLPPAFEQMRPFLDAGFVVFLPSLRGRNQNPGAFELLYGEVDDARAAVTWLSEQPGVDPFHITAVGHSMGGATAAMLSLYPDVPVERTVSIGGIYSTETFVRWSKMGSNQKLIRFDVRDRDELELRVLGPHAGQLAHPHIAYLGSEELRFFDDNVAAIKAAHPDAPFEVVRVPGDHMGSLEPALADLRGRLTADLALTP